MEQHILATLEAVSKGCCGPHPHGPRRRLLGRFGAEGGPAAVRVDGLSPRAARKIDLKSGPAVKMITVEGVQGGLHRYHSTKDSLELAHLQNCTGRGYRRIAGGFERLRVVPACSRAEKAETRERHAAETRPKSDSAVPDGGSRIVRWVGAVVARAPQLRPGPGTRPREGVLQAHHVDEARQGALRVRLPGAHMEGVRVAALQAGPGSIDGVDERQVGRD